MRENKILYIAQRIQNRMDVYDIIWWDSSRSTRSVCANVEARPNDSPLLVKKAQSFSCANVAHLIKMCNPYIECCSHFLDFANNNFMCCWIHGSAHTTYWDGKCHGICIKSEFTLFFSTNLRAQQNWASKSWETDERAVQWKYIARLGESKRTKNAFTRDSVAWMWASAQLLYFTGKKNRGYNKRCALHANNTNTTEPNTKMRWAQKYGGTSDCTHVTVN